MTESRVRLLKGAGDFSKVISARGSQTVLYMPWPAQNRPFDFHAVRESRQSWTPAQVQLLQQAAAEANAAEVGRVQAFRSR